MASCSFQHYPALQFPLKSPQGFSPFGFRLLLPKNDQVPIYEVVFKPGKANFNADYLSRQRGTEAASTILPSFLDEFVEEEAKDLPEDVPVFHLSGDEPSAYEDVIGYLTDKAYPPGLTREEKMVFQTKVAPFTLIKGTLFRMGPDDQLRRCLEKPE